VPRGSPFAGHSERWRVVEGRLDLDAIEVRGVGALRFVQPHSPSRGSVTSMFVRLFKTSPATVSPSAASLRMNTFLRFPMAVHSAQSIPLPPSSTFPPGFSYCPDVITSDDERRLLNQIADLPFKGFQFHGFEGKRRVVSFGWRYDFSEHKALPADPIPDFLLERHRKIQAVSGCALPDLAQVLVTEYAPGAPIGWHKDRPFCDDVMGLSLASVCNFRLRKPLDNGKWQRVSLRLEPRSAYLLQGAARREWEHSIPPVESLRYSVTFRNLRSRAGTDVSFA
jgi:alkylated DNA repair dioxygenase AlkB